MTSSEQFPLRVVRDEPREAPAQRDVMAELLDDPRQLHELVDVIVDRIERRVIDELERRGRRHNLGAF
jgi:hypothetical protein